MSALLNKLEVICSKNPTSLLFARLAEGVLRQNDLKRAQDICRRGLRYRPSYAAGHLVMGKCYLASERFEDARQEFHKVLQLDSDNLAALWYLGQVELELGFEDRALGLLERAYVLDSFNSELAERIEMLKKGSRDEGLGESGLSLGPGLQVEIEAAAADQDLTALVEEIGGDGAASENLEPIATSTLAELYAEQGLMRKALDILERVHLRDPEDLGVKQRLEELRSSFGVS